MAPILGDDGSESLFHIQKISQWVSVPPSSLAAPLPAICASVFSPLLLSYYPPAGGIVLAWQDVEVSDSPPVSVQSQSQSQSKSQPRSRQQLQSSESDSESDEAAQPQPLLLKVVDEYSAPFVWATASLLVLRPKKNAYIHARITHQASTHITLSYLNAFSVSVVQDHLPEDWTWSGATTTGARKENDADGYWMDGDLNPVEETLRVRIRDWDARIEGKGIARGFLRIEGSLITEDGERSGDRDKRKKGKGKGKAKSALKVRSAVEGQASAEAMEID